MFDAEELRELLLESGDLVFEAGFFSDPYRKQNIPIA